MVARFERAGVSNQDLLAFKKSCPSHDPTDLMGAYLRFEPRKRGRPMHSSAEQAARSDEENHPRSFH
jgi:hypothetical protein